MDAEKGEHHNPPLKLQPVIVNEDSRQGNKLTLHPQLPCQSNDHPLTTDDLWSMWNVATKAKSSINQGQRLENLSWRLWYSTAHRQPRQPSTVTQPIQGKQQLDPNLARTCSSILLEIQQAATHGDPFSRSFASDDSDGGANVTAAVGQLLVRETPTSPPASPSQPITMDGVLSASCVRTAALTNSNTSTNSNKTTNEYLARKKKKNVERYMRKYQKRLEGILEEHEPKDDPTEDTAIGAHHEPGSSMSTADSHQSDSHPPRDEHDDLFTRRSSEDISSPKSSLSDKPSLLSRLLSKARSPGGCCDSTHHTPRPIAPIPRPCPANICMCDSSSLDDDDFMDCLGQS